MIASSFIKGIMAFNKRVLYSGNVTPIETYTIQELKEKIFFNSIFLENMQEVFQKYSCMDIIDDYVDSLNQYIHNIGIILDQIHTIDPRVIFSQINSFERRLMINDIKNQLISNYYPPGVKSRFLNDII